MKVAAGITMTHNPFGEDYWASCLRENLTSSSYGEGLETDRKYGKAPRQSLTRQLFFKWIKQNLKIKAFYGTSKNAVLIQIWTALIAYLLLVWLKLKSKVGLGTPATHPPGPNHAPGTNELVGDALPSAS